MFHFVNRLVRTNQLASRFVWRFVWRAQIKSGTPGLVSFCAPLKGAHTKRNDPSPACGLQRQSIQPNKTIRPVGSRSARVVGPCGGETRRANPVERTRHGKAGAAWAGRGRESADQRGRHRYFRGGMASRRPWEQPQLAIEFVSVVRVPKGDAMHGRNMEKMRDRDGQGVRGGREECADLRLAVAEGSDEHGNGLAHPSQPEATASHPSDTCADMAGFRDEVGREQRHDGAEASERAMGPVGDGAGSNATSVCQGGEPDVVTGPVSTANVLALLDRQGYRCALTGRPLTPETAALDHVVPLRFGGEHLIENTQVLHKDVNRAKNSMTNEVFAAMCGEVVRWSAGPRCEGEVDDVDRTDI